MGNTTRKLSLVQSKKDKAKSHDTLAKQEDNLRAVGEKHCFSRSKMQLGCCKQIRCVHLPILETKANVSTEERCSN